MKYWKVYFIILAVFMLSYSCMQIILAQQIVPLNPHTVNIINGTDWEMLLAYTTPEGVSTNDSISPSGSKKIIAKDDNIRYSLAKEQGKTKTDISIIPLDAINRGAFQLTPSAEAITNWMKSHATSPLATPSVI